MYIDQDQITDIKTLKKEGERKCERKGRSN